MKRTPFVIGFISIVLGLTPVLPTVQAAGEEGPAISEVTPFTLRDGTTQLSWVTSVPTAPAVIRYGTDGNRRSAVNESEGGLRNHRVLLHGLPQGETVFAEVTIPAETPGADVSRKVVFQAGARPVPGPSESAKIRLTVAEETSAGRRNWPVTSGVPFSAGALAQVGDIRLTDEAGNVLPAQFEPFCRWPDGSVKWLICHFRAKTEPNQSTVYYLETGPGLGRHADDETGSAVLTEDQKGRLTKILEKITSRIVLADGTLYECRPAPFRVESAGPLFAEIQGFGSYRLVNAKGTGDDSAASDNSDGRDDSAGPSDSDAPDDSDASGFRQRFCVTLFGDDFARIRWSVGNHRLEEPMTPVKSIDLSFERDAEAAFVFSDGKRAEKSAAVLQSVEKSASVDLDGKESNREHFDGFVQSGDQSFFFRDFWQTWPKGLVCGGDRVTFNILPALPDGYYPEDCETVDELFRHYYWRKENAYLFKRGMEIRHDVWIALKDSDTERAALKNSDEERAALAAHLAVPLFAACDPDYYCATGTFPPCRPVQKGEFDLYEKGFRTSFDNIQEGQRTRGDYGWMNYGDWFGECRYNWGNNEYDGTYLTLLHFLRSGDLDSLDWGIRSARHYTTVDFIAYPWNLTSPERMYLHCTGHVNYFFSQDDPRLQSEEVKKTPLYHYDFEQDGSGGHAYHPGNFYAACLTGDRRIFEVAETACALQAMRYTRNFSFGIERSAGWVLTNAVNAYLFTGNPYYRNAADLYFEAIRAAQNPRSGGFDLPQDLSECDCPDKEAHRGGKAFAVGVLMHGLIRYYEITRNPAARDAVVRCSDWLLDSAWNEAIKGFRYKTGCPKYENSGYYCLIVAEGIAFSGDVTGNPRYIDFLVRTLGPVLSRRIYGTGAGEMKDFTQDYRHIPHALYYLHKRGIDRLETEEKK